MAWIIPKWPWTLQGQKYPTCVLLVSPSHKFYSVLLYEQLFLSYRPFWDKCTEWHQNDEPHEAKGTQYITDKPEAQISVHCTFWPAFLSHKTFWEVHRITENALEAYKIKCICVTSVPDP